MLIDDFGASCMLGTLDVTVLDPEASDAQTKFVLKYSVPVRPPGRDKPSWICQVGWMVKLCCREHFYADKTISSLWKISISRET